MAIESFVDKWSINGEDLIKNGAYEWAADMLKRYKNILEIGCGTGHSTFVLLATGHTVFAIDKSIECIESANALVSENFNSEIVEEVTMTEADAAFMKADLFEPTTYDMLQNMKNIDAIVVWNPGQTTDTINFIDQCVSIAKHVDKPIQIVERAPSKESGIKILKDISAYNNIRLVDSDFMTVKWAEDGIQLHDIPSDTVCLAAGVFFPR